MADTLNDCIQECRALIRKARTLPVNGLYLDEAGDVQDRLLRADAALVEISARIQHETLEGVVDNPRPPARFNGLHQDLRAELIPERRRRTDSAPRR